MLISSLRFTQDKETMLCSECADSEVRVILSADAEMECVEDAVRSGDDEEDGISQLHIVTSFLLSLLEYIHYNCTHSSFNSIYITLKSFST